MDEIQTAQEKLGCRFPESVLYRAALEAGYGAKSEDRAQSLMLMYNHGGFNNLPPWCKKAVLEYGSRPPKAA